MKRAAYFTKKLYDITKLHNFSDDDCLPSKIIKGKNTCRAEVVMIPDGKAVCFDNLINNSGVKDEKMCEIFGYFAKKLLLCTLFCGSSLKAGRK